MSAVWAGIGWEVEVAAAVLSGVTIGRWDQARWDSEATWSHTDTSLGDWLDVTCDAVVPWVINSGSSEDDGVVTRWEAASLQLTLIGPDRRYDPWSGPYAGLLGPMLPVRVRARPIGDTAWRPVFTGFVNDDGFTYDPQRGAAALVATDSTVILARADTPERTPQGQGETAADRVGRILDNGYWPAAARDITGPGVAVKSTTLADAAWTQLLQVADTDLALMWVNRAGSLAYRSQARVGSLPADQLAARLMLCAPEPVPPGPPVRLAVEYQGTQPTIVRNRVSVSRQVNEGAPEASTVTVDVPGSIARYGPRSYTRTDLIHVDDSWSKRVANAIAITGAFPSHAPALATLSSRADPAVTDLLLTIEPDDLVEVTDMESGRWVCGAAGWSVTMHPDEVAGDVYLTDMTKWQAAGWDSSKWDTDKWGF